MHGRLEYPAHAPRIPIHLSPRASPPPFARASLPSRTPTTGKVGKVTQFSSAFEQASKFNRNLGYVPPASSPTGSSSGWDVSKGVSFSAMFKGASAFNADVTTFNFGASVDTVRNMFEDDVSFNQDLSTWASTLPVDGAGKSINFAKITNFQQIFTGCTGLSSCNKRKIHDAWVSVNTLFGETEKGGDYDTSWASDKCTACPIGERRDGLSSSCIKCGQGTYAEADNVKYTCEQCAIGKYIDQTGKGACIKW